MTAAEENKVSMKSIGKTAQSGACVAIANTIKPKVISMSRTSETMASARRWLAVPAQLS